jgi:glycine betaine/proline transport system ATP-binding protein
VDRNRRLLGVLRDDDVLAGQRRGVETLAELTRDEVTAVGVDAPLAEIFAPSAETPLPVPVVDDDGRLVGVIPRVTLLEAMAPTESANGDGSGGTAAAASAPPGRTNGTLSAPATAVRA